MKKTVSLSSLCINLEVVQDFINTDRLEYDLLFHYHHAMNKKYYISIST